MATYDELFELSDYQPLVQKVVEACVIAAVAIKDEATPVSSRIAWANSVLSNPRQVGGRVIWAVLALNAGAPVTNIKGASDSAIQDNVDDLVDLLAGVPAA